MKYLTNAKKQTPPKNMYKFIAKVIACLKTSGGGRMTFIIENVSLYKQNELITTSLLVNNGKILSVQPSFSKYLYMKMNTSNFLMTSTSVYYADGLPQGVKTEQVKEYLSSKYIENGCTTVFVSASINDVKNVDHHIREVRNFYDHSPVDYTIAVKIPIEQFTVPFVQKCKRKRIPAIFIEFKDKRELYKVPWGWIREALFPYNSPLIPVLEKEISDKELLLHSWNTILQREKIPHIQEPISEQTPLPIDILKQIGIYPLKGYLQTGGELSYNLYLNQDNKNTVDSVIQGNITPTITVHKGKIVRAGTKVFPNVNQGEEFIINRPAFFK